MYRLVFYASRRYILINKGRQVEVSLGVKVAIKEGDFAARVVVRVHSSSGDDGKGGEAQQEKILTLHDAKLGLPRGNKMIHLMAVKNFYQTHSQFPDGDRGPTQFRGRQLGKFRFGFYHVLSVSFGSAPRVLSFLQHQRWLNVFA